jgi:hypothetical protein
MVAGQRFTGGADGVEFVGLRAVTPGRTCGAVDFDDPLPVFEQVSRQPRPEAAGAFDRPDPSTWDVFLGEGEHPPIAEGVGGELDCCQRACGGVDDGDGVMVSVSVDADDGVDCSCKHGHAVLLVDGRPWTGVGPGEVTARQDCDEARRSTIGQASDQASGRWAGPAPTSAATYPTRRHPTLVTANVTFESAAPANADPASDGGVAVAPTR